MNHTIFVTKFGSEGKDGFDILDAWIRDKSEEHWRSDTNDSLSPKSVDVYRRFGVLPIGDTAN